MRAVAINIKPWKEIKDKDGKASSKKLAPLKELSKPISIQSDSMYIDQRVKLIKTQSDDIELEKHVKNLKMILKYSNASELDRSNRGFFKCPDCQTIFEKPNLLKDHVLSTHDPEKLNMKNRLTMKNFCAMLDVTGLSCKLCSLSCSRLDNLTEHLKTSHLIEFQKTFRNLMFEFDFSNGFICAICTHSFLNFKALAEHMNVHYRYFICDDCSLGYATVARLQQHKYRHKKGSFKCDDCEEVFDVQWRKVAHIRRVHRAPIKVYKCPVCPERYAKINEMKKHALEVHGEEIRANLKCPACDKVCMNRQSLARHKRKDHLLERNYACNLCSKTFFQRCHLADHMITHAGGGEKIFQCHLCLKVFGRKQTLRKHVKTHAHEKDFSCAHCGQQFSQKCSLKRHLRNKHDEIE